MNGAVYVPDKDYIVLDMEFTQWRTEIHKDKDQNIFVYDKSRKLYLNVPYTEIIEIGAVRVRNHKIVESFHTYVQPFNLDLTSHVIKLTGITREKLEKAPCYTQAFEKFVDWIYSGGQSIRMGCWGQEDRRQLYRDCSHHMVDSDILDTMFENYINIQTLFSNAYKKLLNIDEKRTFSLKTAVDVLDLAGNQRHTALGDATDTANVMIAVSNGKLDTLAVAQ